MHQELFWPIFSRIRTEYGDIRSITRISTEQIFSDIYDTLGVSTVQNNSEYGQFSRSVIQKEKRKSQTELLLKIFSSLTLTLLNLPYTCTAWKASKYGVFSGPFCIRTEYIWILFTRCCHKIKSLFLVIGSVGLIQFLTRMYFLKIIV